MNIVLIPGINPAAAQGIFSAIKAALAKEKFVQLPSADENLLETEVKNLKKEKFILVGKSAGGRLALEHQLRHKAAAALVLLAPAVEADTKFSEIKVPVLIVHGSSDPVIPIANSKKLQKILSNCKLVAIEGTDHGYRGKEKEAAKFIADWIKTEI